jgi:phage terminase large subunit-like protein
MEAMGFDSLAITQSAKNLNDATVDFRLEVTAGNVEHDGNEAMAWSVANAKTVSNSFGEIKIEKDLQTERIDIVDAIIDAWTMAMKGEVKPDVNEFVQLWLQQNEQYMQKGGKRG